MSRWTPRVTVASVIERAGCYLMVEELSKNPLSGPRTLFNQPAGHLEPGETLLAAAEREIREESAWHVGLTDYLGLYTYQAPDGLFFHSHGFLGIVLAHLGTPLDSAILATHWLTFEELEEQKDEAITELAAVTAYVHTLMVENEHLRKKNEELASAAQNPQPQPHSAFPILLDAHFRLLITRTDQSKIYVFDIDELETSSPVPMSTHKPSITRSGQSSFLLDA